MQRDLGKIPRCVVVKVGSAVLARAGVLDPACVMRLAGDLAACLAADPERRVVLVSSGAVASGFRALGLSTPPVGTTQFVGCAIGAVSVGTVMRTIWPFYGALIFALGVVTFVPAFSTWLPGMFMAVK